MQAVPSLEMLCLKYRLFSYVLGIELHSHQRQEKIWRNGIWLRALQLKKEVLVNTRPLPIPGLFDWQETCNNHCSNVFGTLQRLNRKTYAKYWYTEQNDYSAFEKLLLAFHYYGVLISTISSKLTYTVRKPSHICFSVSDVLS